MTRHYVNIFSVYAKKHVYIMPHKIIHYLHHILLTFPVFCILCVFTAHMLTFPMSYIMRIFSEHVSRRGQGRGQADLQEGVL